MLARGCAAWGLCLLLLVSASNAWAQCTVDAAEGTIVCDGDVPELAPGNATWAATLDQFQNASSAALEFNSVTFSSDSFQRMVTLVAGVGGSATVGTVSVDLKECSMRDTEVDVASAQLLAGSTQYVFTLTGCAFANNSINATLLTEAETNLDVTLRLLGSELSNNTLLAAGTVVVGATGRAALSLTQGSTVATNKAVLIGLLMVGGDGDLSVQLAASNLTGNRLEQMGTVLLGGNGTATIEGAGDAGTSVSDNTVDSRVLFYQDEPLIASLAGILTGLSFETAGFNLSTSLTQAQGELCSVLSELNMTASPTPNDTLALIVPAVEKITGIICNGSQPSPGFSLASLAPALQELVTAGSASNSGALASLEGVLESLLGGQADDVLQGLVSGLLNGTLEVGTALDDLLSTLLSSPAGDAAAGAIADLLTQLGEWLETPLFGNNSSPGSSNSTNSTTDGSGGGQSLGDIVGDIVQAASGGAVGSAVGDAVGGVADFIQQLLGSLTGSGGGNGTAPGNGTAGNGTAGGVTPESILQQIVQGLTGGGDSPLAGVDLAGLLPILRAVIASPEARQALPGLLTSLMGGGGGGGEGAGGLDLAALGPLLQAITADPEATAALPNLLGLLGNLGIQL